MFILCLQENKNGIFVKFMTKIDKLLSFQNWVFKRYFKILTKSPNKKLERRSEIGQKRRLYFRRRVCLCKKMRITFLSGRKLKKG